MGKQSMYFESYDDVIQYYGSLESIPSKHLVIVQESGAIYANSNNAPDSGGQTEELGGEPISDEDRELVQFTLEGEPEEEEENE